MVRLASRSFLLSIALGCATGCGGSPREQDLGLSRAAIVGGATDFDDAAVVYVLILSGDAGASLGTGTVVSPHVVLTAAHVVDRYLGDPAGSFRVFIGVDRRATGSNPDNWLSVREAHADPGFNARFMGSGHDVGVLILDAPTVIPPKPINRAPVDMTWVGKSMRIVGYGITSSDDINATTSGLRREATTSIQSVGSSFLGTAGSTEQPCGGDSGGPGMVIIDGVEKVAGVVSTGDATCTTESFARVDVSAAFVDQWIAAVDGPPHDAGTDAPEEAAPITAEPPPNPDPTDEPPVAACSQSHSPARGVGFFWMAIVLDVIRRWRRGRLPMGTRIDSRASCSDKTNHLRA